ncbi:oxidase ustYa family protein [Aspergillus tanneri]|uniref:Tat pathway signal sequence n=1 Tax=Aspergillus tanneri TaxID=1220188 RepID=A0A5M9MEB1_9EURO|nr:uncharacterized protein ATNIH1004_006690 [Aspergillus tanneri]KAA8645271.1 hypothetical protein ATNIH1004_006690 [Aspergillus tanneri]
MKGVAEIPVEREIRQFHTGVHNEITEFFGDVNDKTNAAWQTILDAGLIKLTPDQASRLPHETARNPHDPSTYVGILEAFHQLHCLNAIWEGFYDPEKGFSHPVHGHRDLHPDHCFEYLRQNILCWSDTNIGTIAWNVTLGQYKPNYEPVKECYNFDKIHEWAKRKENFVRNEYGQGTSPIL